MQMTETSSYEVFKHQEGHPRHRDVPAIFQLDVIETEDLKDDKISHYPMYKVSTYSSFGSS